MSRASFSGIPWRARLALLSIAALAQCLEDSGDSGRYGLRWRFLNQSSQQASFSGTDLHANPPAGVSADVPAGGTQGPTSTAYYDSPTIQVRVQVFYTPPGSGGSANKEWVGPVPVAKDSNTIITTVWDGTELTVTSALNCPSPAGGPARIATPFEPSAASCQAPVKWKLDGTTGNASANWQDIAASATGTLTFNVPQEVEPGQTYIVSATFSGSITTNAGWALYRTNLGVGMIDRVTFGLSADNTRLTEALGEGTSTHSITVNGAWVIPSNPSSLAIEATGGWSMAGPGNANPPKLVATYSKQP